ncbi:LysR family transcriptional regulator ArgP [Motiliproteus sediminis]|uniref:LysR family transcriptional regulator ArgP n=1 Tax=Motiliproteus sediminis TaxID=1468178 RepID=UPI001AF0226E|nr:LysR family transcriptional regulator ArgP [Motiliproteus sediminis]
MYLDDRQIQTFAAVADNGSFERAAQRLHLTQSAVSQRLKQLEERLGQLLIIRSQPLQLTPAGEQLLTYHRQQQLLQAELLAGFEQTFSGPGEMEGATRLAIALNADSLATWFLPALRPLLGTLPILLDLRVSDQDQTQRFLRRGEVFGCISASSEPLQGCSCKPLGVMSYRAVASPEFMLRYFPAGVSAEALRRAPAVDYDSDDALQRRYLQQRFGLGSGDYPRHRVPSPEAYLQLVEAGLGWGMVPDMQSEALLSQGRLLELTPGHLQPVALFWHRLRLQSSRLQAVEETLLNFAARHF